MRTIAIANPKGGSGKTTIATCLASHLCYEGFQVALADADPQQSAADWLALRPAGYPPIYAVQMEDTDNSYKKLKAPTGTDILILDTHAGLSGSALKAVLKKADTLIVPIIPSPIDMRAAWRFLQHLSTVKSISKARTKTALIANRCKARTLIYKELTGFLNSASFPFISHLRETQNYIKAAESGLGIADLPAWQAWQDWEEWEPLIHWIKSSDSQP